MNNFLISQVDTSVSYKSGYYAGQFIIFVLLLAGILKCISIARRPTTNKKCVHSLTCFLLMFLLAAVSQFLIRVFPDGQKFILPVIGICVFAGLITGIVLAILGLIEYSKKKPDYTQGRSQAISTLVISGIFLAISVAGFFKGRENALAFKKNQPHAGEILSFPDLNYTFKAPAQPWVKLDAKRINKVASLGFMRASPQIFFMVIAENAGISFDLESAQLLDLCKANLQSAGSRASFGKEFARDRQQLHGLQLESDVQINNLDISYVHWVCVTNGYAYQLVCWGPPNAKSKLRDAAEELFSRFDLIDYRQVSQLSGQGAADFQSTHFPYRVRLKNSSWQPWQSLEKQMPQVEFGALSSKPRDAAMVVVPVNLNNFEPNSESLNKALLSVFNISYPNEKLSGQKKIRHQDSAGVEFEFERGLDGKDYSYRFRIIKQNGLAYLLAVWTEVSAESLDDFFEDSFSRVEFTNFDSTSPATENYTHAGKQRQGFLLNQVGVYYYVAKQYEKSLPYFQTAFKLDPEAAIYLDNVLNAQANLGNYLEALAFLEKAPAAIVQKNEIQAIQARLQMQADQSDKALETFARLFATDFRNDDYFVDYLSLLNQSKEIDQALVAIETYLRKRDSATVRIWQAGFLQQKKQFSEAITILKTQREKFPNNPQIGHALVEAYLSASLDSDAANLATEMIRDEDESYYAYYLKGRAEFQLKRYREAKVSFETALKKISNQ